MILLYYSIEIILYSSLFINRYYNNKVFNILTKINMDEKSLLNIGKKLRDKKIFKEAFYYFDEVIRLNTFNKLAWFYKALMFNDMQSYDNAIECYNEVLKINDDYAAWYNKGLAYSNLDKYKEALDCFDEVLRIRPHHKDAIECKIALLYYFKKFEEIIKYTPKKINNKYKNT